jgi:hypothetical protein
MLQCGTQSQGRFGGRLAKRAAAPVAVIQCLCGLWPRPRPGPATDRKAIDLHPPALGTRRWGINHRNCHFLGGCRSCGRGLHVESLCVSLSTAALPARRSRHEASPDPPGWAGMVRGARGQCRPVCRSGPIHRSRLSAMGWSWDWRGTASSDRTPQLVETKQIPSRSGVHFS